MSILGTCGAYLEVTLSECPENIFINLGLEVEEQYAYKIIDRHGKVTGGAISFKDGKFEIDTAVFPQGSFNRHSGAYTLQIFKADDLSAPVSFTCGTDELSTIVMRFEDIEFIGFDPENTIRC